MNVAGALLLGYLIGSGPAVSEVEQGVSAGIRDYLGLPESCEVVTTLQLESRGNLVTGTIEAAQVDLHDVDLGILQLPPGVGVAAPEGNLRGRVEKLTVNLHRPTADGFAIERLSFVVAPVEFNLGKLMARGGLSVTSAGSAEAEIVIDPREVAHYIDSRSDSLKEVELDLVGDREVTLRGRVGLGILSPSVEVSGRLEITARGIEIAGPRVRFAGLPVPAFVTDRIMKDINPIFAVGEGSFLGDIVLPRSLAFEEGKVIIRGGGNMPFLPAPAGR